MSFFDRFQLGKPKSWQSLPLKYDLGAEMYLVQHVRGRPKTAFLFTQQYPWNAKQNPPKIPVGPKLEIEQPSG